MSAPQADHAPHDDIPRWMVLLLAAACGIIVANLYYAQPLIGPISRATGISPGAAGLIVTRPASPWSVRPWPRAPRNCWSRCC